MTAPDTLVFCTSWADSAELWRFRYGKWLAHLEGSRLNHAQVLFIDDGSPSAPPIEGLATLDAERLPANRPAAKRVLARFPNRLGRPAVLDYPGWWRSFMWAANYAATYSFEKIIHIESDAFILSEALTDYLNDIRSGWTALWCPYIGLPESCIQVIGKDQFPAYQRIAREPYANHKGQPAERLLPFTHVECCFKGDRYGEYRTELPLDADWSSQVGASTAIWRGPPPSARTVLALSIGTAAIPPHPALFQRDAWHWTATFAHSSAADLAAHWDAAQPCNLDALQISIRGAAAGEPDLPFNALRRHLRPDGELLIQVSPSIGKGQLERLIQSALRAGFAVAGGLVSAVRGDFLIMARNDDPRPASLRNERLARRLHLAGHA